MLGTPAVSPHHGQDLPPAPAAPSPVAESRGVGTKRWGNEGAGDQGLTPDYLDPPSPEKNAPRADEGASGRASPAGPEPEGGAAMLVGR